MPVFMSTHLNDSLRPTGCSIADIEFLRLTIENRAHPPFLRAFRPPLTGVERNVTVDHQDFLHLAVKFGITLFR